MPAPVETRQPMAAPVQPRQPMAAPVQPRQPLTDWDWRTKSREEALAYLNGQPSDRLILCRG